ncbi:MAG: hypothetical protein SGARI_003118 [Bacillariaceae sp.]
MTCTRGTSSTGAANVLPVPTNDIVSSDESQVSAPVSSVVTRGDGEASYYSGAMTTSASLVHFVSSGASETNRKEKSSKELTTREKTAKITSVELKKAEQDLVTVSVELEKAEEHLANVEQEIEEAESALSQLSVIRFMEKRRLKKGLKKLEREERRASAKVMRKEMMLVREEQRALAKVMRKEIDILSEKVDRLVEKLAHAAAEYYS